MERVLDSSADPAMLGAGFYRVTIHFSVIILKFGRKFAEMSFHVPGDKSRGGEGRPSKNGVKCGKAVTAYAAHNDLVEDC